MVTLVSSKYKDMDPAKMDVEKATDEDLKKMYDDLQKSIDDSSAILGLGWSDATCRTWCDRPFTTIVGWILTAFAISLGAPFWFDLLNKIMMLRGGKKTEVETAKETKKEASKENRVA